MIDRQALNGYEDGTFRLDQTITKQESSYILARFLGVPDAAALTDLTARFGVIYEEGNTLSDAAARKLIGTALKNDETAIEWINEASKKQMDVSTFSADVQMEMTIVPKAGTEQAESFQTTSTSRIEFNKDQGIHQLTTAQVPGPSGLTKVEMDQYTVNEGIYIKTPDPVTGTAKWLNMSKQIPLTFEQLMALQKSNLELTEKFITPYFFYRDFGAEEVEGMKLHKMELNGRLIHADDFFKALGGITSDQSMFNTIANAPELSQMSMSVVLWFDESSKLMKQLDAKYWITYGDAAEMPLDRLEMTMTATYKDYNEAIEIKLPEEAKQAEELPALTIPQM